MKEQKIIIMSTDQFNIADFLFNLLANLMYGVLMGVAPLAAPTLGIPSDVLVEYLRLLTIWNKAYEKTKNKNGSTHTNIVAKDEAKLELANFLRPFVQKWLYNNMPPCTAEIITSCGLKPHSTTRTSHQGKPKEIPAFGAKPNASHGFDCSVRNESGKVAKPIDSAIMRIRIFIGEDAPKDPAEFPIFQDFSRTPIIVVLPADSAGKTIVMATCYVSKGGEEGDYSNIITTKIP